MTRITLPESSVSPWRHTDDAVPSGHLSPHEVDVCVVGAGIAGLAAASMLADQGLSVAIVEACRPGYGTTGRSSAKVSVLHGHNAERIASTHDRHAAITYLQANQWGLTWMRQRAEELSLSQWEDRPAITYAVTSDAEDAVTREHAILTAAGLESAIEMLPMPWGRHPALICGGQAQIDPQEFVDALTQRCVASGASLHRETTVTGIDERSHCVLIETNRCTISARHVVIATNLPIADRGLHFARTVPQTSHIVGVKVRREPPPGMYLSAGGPLRSIRTATDPDGDRIVLVGGEGHRTGTVDDTIERQQTLLDWANTHLGVTDVAYRFSAQDYTTPDHIPFAGPIRPGSDRVHVITGLNKWGFTNAPAAAAVVAAHIVDAAERPAWSELFSATRLPREGVGEIAKAGAEVARHAVVGWATSLRNNPRQPGQPVGDGPERPCVASGVCTHLGGIVRWNDAARTWDCPLHGSRFTESGTVMHAPATRPLRGAGETASEGVDR